MCFHACTPERACQQGYACRCLLAGSAHDLPVIFKLSRMWFSLGGDKEIVSEMAEAACEVPSYKFLPLAYQLASRLSRIGRNKSLDDSGFSVRPSQSAASHLKHHTRCGHTQHMPGQSTND